MRHNLFCAWSLTIVRSLHVHVTTVMLTKCSCLLAGLPALPVKESASTLRMDIRALMAWTDRHKPVSIERLHPPPPACFLLHVLSELTNDCTSASLYIQLYACSLPGPNCLLTGCSSLCVLNHVVNSGSKVLKSMSHALHDNRCQAGPQSGHAKRCNVIPTSCCAIAIA